MRGREGKGSTRQFTVCVRRLGEIRKVADKFGWSGRVNFKEIWKVKDLR